MPDDPDAIARLTSATHALQRACGHPNGLSTWGDALPHHPDQKPGMTDEQIADLHRRPAKMPVNQLTARECDYFFSHAAANVHSNLNDLRHAIRYFLPRYARQIIESNESELPVDPAALGAALGVSKWWELEQISPAITEWLVAWLNVAVKCRRELPQCRHGILTSDYSSRNLSSTIDAVIKAGIDADLFQTELRSWTVQIWICVIADIVNVTSNGVEVRIIDTNRATYTDSHDRTKAASDVLKKYLASERLKSMLEEAVLAGQLAEQASVALSYVERLNQSHAL